VRHPLLVLDKDLRVVSASSAYLNTFKVTSKETVGNLLYRLGNGQWGIPQLRACLEAVIAKGVPFDDFLVEHEFERIGRRRMHIGGRHIPRGVRRDALALMQIEEAGPPD